MLLYERGGAGRELSQSPLCANLNVLFIMRVSEISCEVVEEVLKGARTEGMRGSQTSHAVILQAPVSALHIARPVLWVLRPENGEVSGWDLTAGPGGGGALAPGAGGLPLWVGKQRAKRKPFLSSQPPQTRAQGSSASGPVPWTLPDLGIGFYITDFIAFLYNSRLLELGRPWRSSICPHPFHGLVKRSPETEWSHSQLGAVQQLE